MKICQAGIPKHLQTLIIEPEAAAFYCEQKDIEVLTRKEEEIVLTKLSENTKYLVVDLGGKFM